MKKNLQIILTVFFLCSTLAAQAESVKREFRGAWLSTVWAIDWPATRDTAKYAENKQKEDMIRLLDRYVQSNVNVCFFQVRGMSDAFYDSKYEPWSQYLCGERGLAPNYDPFQFVIEECHKRGIECHAWINPYRYSTAANNHGTGPDDYATTHPEWLMDCGGTVILNPGMPEVRQRICDVVSDIMSKYDIDGVVFDDYFYVNGATLLSHDQALYDAYVAGLGEGETPMERADWRRDNVNQMVRDVYRTIKSKKPWIRFGISPAGVAASSASVAAKYGISPCPSGSDWQYNGLYSEPVQWLVDNSIDYISPQVYWTIGSSNDYSKIVPWWGMVAHRFNRHNYTSASLSALGNTTIQNAPAGATEVEKRRVAAATNYNAYETVDEILINRQSAKEGAPGMVFFSTRSMTKTNFIKVITQDVYSRKALVPALTWFKAEEQGLVTNLTANGQELTWQYPIQGLRYNVYAMPKAERQNVHKLASSEYLVATTYTTACTLPEGISSSTHAIAVCVFDRYGNEFAPRFVNEELAEKATVKLISPADKADVLLPGWLTWEPVQDAMAYTVEIAYDENFTELIALAQTDSAALLTQKFSAIDGSKTTYWRVKAHKANAESDYSETRSFTGKVFSVTSPADGEVVPVTPTITWDNAGGGTTYRVEIAETTSFKGSEKVLDQTTTDTFVVVPADVLRYSKMYYVRVTATSPYVTVTSLVNAFTTEEVVMVAPTIISPETESKCYGASLKVEVGDTPNNGFRFELATKNTFPKRSTKIIQTEPGVRVAEYTGLADGEYYIRVATRIDLAATTEFSEPIHVFYSQGQQTGVEILAHKGMIYISNGILFAVENMEYRVFTAEGKLIHAGVTTGTQTALPKLETGVYVVRVGNETIRYVEMAK